MTATYLLRFDDLCPTMNWRMWREVESVVRDHGIRPIVAVIPDNRDPSFNFEEPVDDFWSRVRAWQADGWTIGLHGYQHVYVSDQRGVCGTDPRSEFAGVAPAEQERKLRAGRDLFIDNGVAIDAWIAPNHSFDETTVGVVRRLGIEVINDGFDMWPHRDASGTFWVPCQLNEFVDRRTGVWTVHYHPNYWDRSRLAGFATDVARFADRITDLATIRAEYGDRVRSVNDAVYSSYRIARSRLKRGAPGYVAEPRPPEPALSVSSPGGSAQRAGA